MPLPFDSHVSSLLCAEHTVDYGAGLWLMAVGG